MGQICSAHEKNVRVRTMNDIYILVSKKMLLSVYLTTFFPEVCRKCQMAKYGFMCYDTHIVGLGVMNMTLLMFIVNYTINEICQGNHSDCARRLHIEYAVLRRQIKQINDGGTSGRLIEAILELYWRENKSLDKALKLYESSRMGADMEAAEFSCERMFSDIQRKVQTQADMNEDLSRILKAACVLGDTVRQCRCQKYCDPRNYQNEECSMRHLERFVDQIKVEMGQAQS